MFCELFGPLQALEEEWRAQSATEKRDRHDSLRLGLCPVHRAQRELRRHHRSGPGGTGGDAGTLDPGGRNRPPDEADQKELLDPLPLDYPIKAMEDWLTIMHWYTSREDRIDREKLMRQKTLRDKGYLTVLGAPDIMI
jgi:hypothetical protein